MSPITVSTLLGLLQRFSRSRPVCFSDDPFGLSLFEVRTQNSVVKFAFEERICRRKDRLIVDSVSAPIKNPRMSAFSVGALIEALTLAGEAHTLVQFGETMDALHFQGVFEVPEHPTWVSINFEEQVCRGPDGSLRVTELREGLQLIEDFPVRDGARPDPWAVVGKSNPNRPLSIEDAARENGWPPALIRLAASLGCPTRPGGLVQVASISAWIGRNHEIVRHIAHLDPLGEKPENCSETRWNQFAMDITLPDYMASRSVNLQIKAAFVEISRVFRADFLNSLGKARLPRNPWSRT